ncbi:hypothetical protein HD842_000767 [Massilia aurea]|uniref:Uncharacterized protein n=1 Tax=Massilia aurea TaxID=373040 RepID=A0A7W9U6R0_9BURK|nr:hypothetical protein [Massilia aurea]MBB6132656.1 hypothetical protein [Massilia aurea]
MKYAYLFLSFSIFISPFSNADNGNLSSCSLLKQKAFANQANVKPEKMGQSYILARIDFLQKDLKIVRNYKNVSKKKTNKLGNLIEKSYSETIKLVREKGFLSAGERASYDRELDIIANDLCQLSTHEKMQ